MLANLKSRLLEHKLHGWVNLPILLSLSMILTASLAVLEPKTQTLEALSLAEQPNHEENINSSFLTIQENTLKAVSGPVLSEKRSKKINVIVTGYSSTVWQTDSTPLITASGSSVRNGIVAANFLPFGTKIKIPQIYGDEVFVVEDRMHPRNNYLVDVWFDNYSEALNFGAHYTYIEVLN